MVYNASYEKSYSNGAYAQHFICYARHNLRGGKSLRTNFGRLVDNSGRLRNRHGLPASHNSVTLCKK